MTGASYHPDGRTDGVAVRIWLQPLPVPDGLGVVATAQARKRAAAAAVAARLTIEVPGLDLSTIRRGAFGKPLLPPPFDHVGFNPSDSGGWFLFGLAAGADIGVDLELRRPRPTALAIAQRHFPQAEVDWLRNQPDIDHAFLRLWTLKEALFKAIGRGLGYGLGQACFQPGPDGGLRLVELAGPAGPAGRWHGHELALGPSHVGGLVTSHSVMSITLSMDATG
jgi:4'-phosphopantetheinyl transferase